MRVERLPCGRYRPGVSHWRQGPACSEGVRLAREGARHSARLLRSGLGTRGGGAALAPRAQGACAGRSRRRSASIWRGGVASSDPSNLRLSASCKSRVGSIFRNDVSSLSSTWESRGKKLSPNPVLVNYNLGSGVSSLLVS